MDAIELLKTQHAEIESLFRKLAAETDPKDRDDLVGRVIDRLTMHAALEEEIFYPAVAKLGRGTFLVDHSRDEHRHVDHLLDELRDMHFCAPAAVAKLAELRRLVEHHVAEEERRLLPVAERLGPASLRELGRRMEERMDMGRVMLRLVASGGRR
jgi:hypothetical protein